jgi:outer membrane protein assembly factor BamB
MKISNKTIATAITVIFAVSITLSMFAIPNVSAGFNTDTQAAVSAGMHWPPPGTSNADRNASANRLLLWNRWRDEVPTYVFIVPTPNPVGVGQEMTLILFNPQVPNPSSDRYLFTVEIKKPSGTVTLPPAGAQGIYNQPIQDGKYVSDSTGSAWALYIPDEVGNYTFTVKFWGPAVSHTDPSFTSYDWWGVTLKPTEYWTRPIEGQNNAWYQVASNWLNNAHDASNGGDQNQYQPDGISPNSGHILWTKSTEDGGVVGGTSFSVDGEVFNAGHQYQTRFGNTQIIMYGRLYYRESKWYGSTPGDYVCVDLRTGEEIWRNVSMSATPSFGYYYDWDDMNQHGVVPPSWLFSNNFGTAIHPRYGITAFNISSVPNGEEVYGPKGEIIRYVLTNLGNTTNPNYYLAQWNSSRVFISTTSASGTIPGNYPLSPAPAAPNNAWNGTHWTTSALRTAQGFASVNSPAYDWNVSVSLPSGSSIQAAIYNDVLLVSNGSLPSAPSYLYAESVGFTGINLNPSRGAVGSIMWGPTAIKLVDTANHNYDFQRASEGVFVFQRDPDMGWMAYDMYTGQKLWESDFGEGDYNPYAYYISSTGYNPTGNAIAYGKLFSTGYSGWVWCYDLKTGKVLWNYSAPTNAEKFKYYTLLIGAINDGKIYIGTHEHSADTPLFKGARVRCLNVTDGKEIWTMLGWANPYTFQVADGILTYWNNYDHQVYALGKGPSAMTVEAPAAAIVEGQSLVIRGTVTDISAGTKQKEQAARFPFGVPAVSDASMSSWMEYVYMQKPRPMDAKGVEVSISVLDANGNYREIGKTTSDSSGFYNLQWTPDIPGKYQVFASFTGSESYWPSNAETAFAVDPAPAPVDTSTNTGNTQTLPPLDLYLAGATAAIIIAIAIVGLLILRKK